jgi:arylsulfatase A-like enzyme
LIDIMATCVEVSGATYPKIYQENEIQPMEGSSLVTIFANQPAPERVLLWEHYGKAAIRKGNWKLVRGLPKGDWELYDIEKDRSEMHNLAQDHPDLAKELAELWEKEAHRTKIYPLPKSYR